MASLTTRLESLETPAERHTSARNRDPDTSPGGSESHGTSDGQVSDHHPARETAHTQVTSRRPITTTGTESESSNRVPQASPTTVRRKGKAPPVDPFTGTDPELRLDD